MRRVKNEPYFRFLYYSNEIESYFRILFVLLIFCFSDKHIYFLYFPFGPFIPFCRKTQKNKRSTERWMYFLYAV